MFCTALAYYGLLVGVYVLVCWEGGGGGDGGGGGLVLGLKQTPEKRGKFGKAFITECLDDSLVSFNT